MPDDRQTSRDVFWSDRDGSTYRCPGCGRPREAVDAIEVHHRDRNRRNPDPDNLIGLCRDCHQRDVHGNDLPPARLQPPAPRDVDTPAPSGLSPGASGP